MTVRLFTSKDAKFYQYADRQIFVGDAVDSSNSDSMSIGFYRNKRKGDQNEWVVTYDEALIVTKGALTVRFADGVKTARTGEVIFLTKGTRITYEAAEDDTEVVYVTYPHWMDVHKTSEHASSSMRTTRLTNRPDAGLRTITRCPASRRLPVWFPRSRSARPRSHSPRSKLILG
jgi:ethanolamine utilization protein EutQ